MSEAKPSVLITGANGFIGSRLCRLFLDHGYTVHAGVRKTANLTLLRQLSVEYRFGDVCHPQTLAEMVADVDYVIHNAGIVKALRAATYFEVNETGTRNLLDAIVANNPSVKKVVYISSLAVSGPMKDGRPRTEEDPPNPLTTYGRSKMAGEKVVLEYANRLPVVIVRPMGVYGPGDKEVLTVFKTVYRRMNPIFGDPQRLIQMVHVDDVCAGVMRSVEANTKSGSIYFLAEPKMYTMAQLIAMLEKACDRKAIRIPIPAAMFRAIAAISEAAFRLVGAVPMLTFDKSAELLSSWGVSTEKAKRELGFVAQIPFDRGAKETFDWYRKEKWL